MRANEAPRSASVNVSPLTRRKRARGSSSSHEEGQCVTRPPGRSEHRLLPGISEPDAQITTVPHGARNRCWMVMEVDDEIVIPLRGELADDPADQRHAVDRNCCLGADIGEGAQAGAEPGRKNQGASRIEEHVWSPETKFVTALQK